VAKTETASSSPTEEKAPKKPGEFVVMQRIDRLLQGLDSRERAGVLAWLEAKYLAATVIQQAPAAANGAKCNHPGY
jgi:hypothetical protein